MKHFLLAITAIFFGLTSSVFAQDIEKKWHVEAVAQTVNDSLATIKNLTL